ncbi:hypothetical protein GX50_05808 [[Emmonsia] crescens]|uniref:Uncharacterized protein n=1 Tax=[Emmonsia] crescens TaxID=73230 RepID=A0A2B7ZDF9_9EURO|nr:hypothetical protein GX50_05808 [Emmonsia crescens]
MYVIGVAESPLETERSGQRTCQVAKASRRGIFGMLAERVSQIGRTSTDDQGPGIGYLPKVPTYLMVGRSATSSSPYEPGKGQWSPGGMEALVLPSAIVTLTIPAHGLTVYKIIWEFFRF